MVSEVKRTLEVLLVQQGGNRRNLFKVKMERVGVVRLYCIDTGIDTHVDRVSVRG